jgi:hypothetical protein
MVFVYLPVGVLGAGNNYGGSEVAGRGEVGASDSGRKAGNLFTDQVDTRSGIPIE